MCVRIYTRVAAYAHVRKTARLDCENYVGKTAIRCRCNNLSWTASRVGGNYAELMRSSSCASRIIYSESASLSPCITQSGFSAAAPPTSASLPPGIHGIRPDKINFPILPKRLRWSERSRMPENRDVTIHRASNRKRGNYYMILTREATIVILQGMLIEANASKSSKIKKSRREAIRRQIRIRCRWKSSEKVINIIYWCHRIFETFYITFIYCDFFDKCKIDFFFSLFFFELLKYK